jgi:hypothetical protein
MALTLFSAVHYDNFMYSVIILGDMAVNPKHYTNFVYSCQCNPGDVRNITPISCTLANGIWETSVNSKHYTNFVNSGQWNLGDVHEFKTLHQFRVFLSVKSGRRPKHYTNFVYSCQWNLGDVHEFKTLHQFRVDSPVECMIRTRIKNITRISCTVKSKCDNNFVYGVIRIISSCINISRMTQ